MDTLRICARLFVAVGVLALVNGCGSSGPERHEIAGTVTYKGQPVDDGIIEFMPLEGQGSKDGSAINNGQYHIPQNKGLFVGKYRVNIYIGDGSSGAGNATPDAPARAPGTKRGVERAPPEFNRDSKQEAVVTAKGPNKFDFKIP